MVVFLFFLLIDLNILSVSLQNGRTALHICCIKENTEIVILLLQNGADVTTVDNVQTQA